MNELILTISKDRILPMVSGLIDFPNVSFCNQLNNLTNFIIKNIMNRFILPTHSNITPQSKLELVLYAMFPIDWLELAEQSPNSYIDISKAISKYNTTKHKLPDEQTIKISKILEFLCYEIIELTTLYIIEEDLDLHLYEFSPRHILKAIELDPVLTGIIKKQQIYMIDQVPDIRLRTSINLSHKSDKLIRIYLHILLKTIIDRISALV
jgi:hypothetical protein